MSVNGRYESALIAPSSSSQQQQHARSSSSSSSSSAYHPPAQFHHLHPRYRTHGNRRIGSSSATASSSSSPFCTGVTTLGLLVVLLLAFALLDLVYVLHDHFNLGGFVQYLPWTDNTVLINDPLHSTESNGGTGSLAGGKAGSRITGRPPSVIMGIVSNPNRDMSVGMDDDNAATPTTTTPTTPTHNPTTPPSSPSDYLAVWGAPPYFDSLEEVASCPPLASMLIKNKVPVGGGGLAVIDTSSLALYMHALQQRLDGSHVMRAHLSDPEWFGTLKDLPEKRRPTASVYKRHADYTIQEYENVCLRMDRRMRDFIFVSPSRADRDAWLNITRTLNDQYKEPHALPPRWVGEQGHEMVADKFDPNWLWVPAVPKPRSERPVTDQAYGTSDGVAIDASDTSPPATMHQFTWDHNVGHQFHHQLWPLYQALHSHATVHSPAVQSLMIDAGCEMDKVDLATNNYMGIELSTWHPIIKFLMRLALVDVQQRVRLLTRPPAACNSDKAVVVCFERLVVTDPRDEYLQRHPLSPEMFDTMRLAILRVVQFDPRPFPVHASLEPMPPAIMPATTSEPARRAELAAHLPPSRPLRVTIYSRQDSSRRRIVNVDEVMAALSPHHIVRHVPNFGKQHPVEQLALYAHTDLLIAPHGAHMTFTFMMPVHAIVVECFAEKEHFSWITHLVNATGKRHVEIVGVVDPKYREEAKAKDSKLRDMDLDFKVDMQALCVKLKEWKVPIEWEC